MKQICLRYYVARRPQTDDRHAIHIEGCPFLPEDTNRIYLGIYDCCRDAVIKGKSYYNNVNRCLFCLKEHLGEAG